MVYQLSIFFNKSIVQKEDFLKMLGGGVWGGGGTLGSGAFGDDT